MFRAPCLWKLGKDILLQRHLWKPSKLSSDKILHSIGPWLCLRWVWHIGDQWYPLRSLCALFRWTSPLRRLCAILVCIFRWLGCMGRLVWMWCRLRAWEDHRGKTERATSSQQPKPPSWYSDSTLQNRLSPRFSWSIHIISIGILASATIFDLAIRHGMG